MNKFGWLLGLLIALGVANLGLTTYIAFRAPPPGSAPSPSSVADTVISEKSAQQLAEQFVENYNKQEPDALYRSLDKLAQVQITEQQHSTQVQKLHSLLGEISGVVYTHAELAGSGDGQTFYNLFYKVSLSGGPIAHGSLRLVVIRNKDKLGLVGFYLNGSDSTLAQ